MANSNNTPASVNPRIRARWSEVCLTMAAFAWSGAVSMICASILDSSNGKVGLLVCVSLVDSINGKSVCWFASRWWPQVTGKSSRFAPPGLALSQNKV